MRNHPLVVAFAFTLATGCDPAGTASTLDLTMSGTLQAPGGQPVTLDVSGPWKPSCDDCVPRITDGGDVGWLAPQFRPPTDDDVFVTVGFDLGLGVKTGPGAVPLEIGLQDTGTSPLTFSDGITIDRSYLTGDPAAMWRIDVLIDTTAQDPATETDVTMSGSAALVFNCAEGESLRCSIDAEGAYEDIAAATPIQYGLGVEATCPTAVLEHFWRPEQALTGDAATQTVRIGDAEPMPCFNQDGYGFCGATAEGIEADGCTWRVDVIRDRELFIHGKASGCERDNVYCSDTLFAAPILD